MNFVLARFQGSLCLSTTGQMLLMALSPGKEVTILPPTVGAKTTLAKPDEPTFPKLGSVEHRGGGRGKGLTAAGIEEQEELWDLG